MTKTTERKKRVVSPDWNRSYFLACEQFCIIFITFITSTEKLNIALKIVNIVTIPWTIRPC